MLITLHFVVHECFHAIPRHYYIAVKCGTPWSVMSGQHLELMFFVFFFCKQPQGILLLVQHHFKVDAVGSSCSLNLLLRYPFVSRCWRGSRLHKLGRQLERHGQPEGHGQLAYVSGQFLLLSAKLVSFSAGYGTWEYVIMRSPSFWTKQ